MIPYCVQLWSSDFKKDELGTEQVERMLARILRGTMYLDKPALLSLIKTEKGEKLQPMNIYKGNGRRHEGYCETPWQRDGKLNTHEVKSKWT